MKHLITFLVMLTCHSAVKSQDKIILYGQPIKASIVLGSGKEWGPKVVHKTDLIKDPVGSESLNEHLGSYYSTAEFNERFQLLNKSLDQASYLDKINFDFYANWAFLNVLDKIPAIKNDPGYANFRTTFRNTTSNVERRTLLYSSENEKFRLALEDSRFTTYRKAIPMKLTQEVKNVFTAGLTGEINAKINENVGANITTDNAFKTTIQNFVVMKSALYHEIKLQEDYISRARNVLKDLNTNKASISTSTDPEAQNLIDFLDGPTFAIITGAAVFEAQFERIKLSELRISLGAVIKANVSPSQQSEAQKIAIKATAQFITDKKDTAIVTPPLAYYYIRLVRDPKLEVGAGAGTSN